MQRPVQSVSNIQKVQTALLVVGRITYHGLLSLVKLIACSFMFKKMKWNCRSSYEHDDCIAKQLLPGTRMRNAGHCRTLCTPAWYADTHAARAPFEGHWPLPAGCGSVQSCNTSGGASVMCCLMQHLACKCCSSPRPGHGNFC